MTRRPESTSLWGNLLRAIIITLFIISAAVVFTLYFRPLYYFDISLLHLDTASGLNTAAVRRNYDAVCNYLFVWNRGELILPDLAMSEHGRIHFADCKVIFDAVQILCLVTGILTLIGALRRRHTSGCLRIAGILTITIPALLGLLAVFQWETLFTVFHRILFRNDYWLFDPRYDPVILILPDSFFFQCAVLILVLVLAGGVFCILKARRSSGRRRR